MLNKNQISILRKHTPVPEPIPEDYCLYFSSDGYIAIDDLSQFLDYRIDFQMDIEFNVKQFPSSGYAWLWNSCFDTSNNMIGTAVNGTNLYVQIDKGSGDKSELMIPFTEANKWFQLSVKMDRDVFSSTLNSEPLVINNEPRLHLPDTFGFKIASNTALLESLDGSVDNILLTDLRNPIAQYPLITGEGTTAQDVISHYDGTILNGEWQVR